MHDRLSPSLAAGLGYRADIDGLRTIAVSLVLVFHAFPASLPGGFAGVDVFFVISGFLISSVILADHRRNTYSIGGFYLRRVRRIFPALLAVFAACFVIGWLILLPGEFRQLSKHIAGGAAFISNLLLWAESGYFDSSSELKPLLHLWSLGVEEQFYILWPLVLYAVVRTRVRPWRVMLGLAAASFIYNLIAVGGDRSAAFYLPLSRFWELMLGGALASVDPRELPGVEKYRNGLALAGAAMLVAGALLLDQTKAFPGWWGLLPTVGTVALIAAGPLAWLNRTVLAHPVMVGIGLISYPLYLWHWPLLSFARIQMLGAPPPAVLGLALLASVVLAWVTYRLIELPVRRQRKVWRPLVGLMILCGGVGAIVFANDGLPQRMPEIAAYDAFFADYRYTETHDLKRHDRQECNFYNITEKTAKAELDPACYTPHSDQVVLVWGDSHAQHLQYGLRKLLEPKISVLQIGASGCWPMLDDFANDPVGACNRANRFALDRIAAIKPEVVVLAQQWYHEKNDYAALIAELRRLGVGHVLLLGPVPQWRAYLYLIVQRAYRGVPPLRSNQNLDPSLAHTDRLLQDRFGSVPGVTFVSLLDHLCNADGCLVYLDGDSIEGLTTYDYGHFTLPASEYVARTLLVPLISRLIPKVESR